MLEQHNRRSVKGLVIFGSGLAYVLSIVMMEALVGFALTDLATSPLMQALIGVGILGTFISACLIPLAMHYWLSPGTQYKIGIGFWLIDLAVLALNAATAYQLIKSMALSDFWMMWQLALPFVGPSVCILGWGIIYLADDSQKDRHADRLLETTKNDMRRRVEAARANAEHAFSMSQIEQVDNNLRLAIQSPEIAALAQRGAYNSALQLTQQIVGMPLQTQQTPALPAPAPAPGVPAPVPAAPPAPVNLPVPAPYDSQLWVPHTPQQPTPVSTNGHGPNA